MPTISYEAALVISLLTGIVCYLFAKEKNYNPISWFIGGFFFSFLAVIIIMAIKKRVSEKKKPA